MLRKIISGGQTGADQGGLLAGKELGLAIGGTAPHGWLTEDGPAPDLLKSLGLVEGPPDETKYKKRTKLNVRNSDGTLVLGDSSSPGSRLTLRYCRESGKPSIVNPTPKDLASWISDNDIGVLNVAGNRERTNPGIRDRAVRILTEAVQMLKEVENN